MKEFDVFLEGNKFKGRNVQIRLYLKVINR